MSKNLIYANADEFHVKSTVVYADGTSQHKLYWDSEHTKPIYSDELKRLFFAGGLKICYLIPIIETGDTHTTFLSPIVFTEDKETAFVMCLVENLDNMYVFSAPVRSISSDDSLPSNQGDPAQ